MIDRGEDAHQRERRRQRPHARRRGDQDGGGADAEEEDHHHRAAPPEVAQPARRQRAEPEHDERADRIRHEVLPDHAPVGRDGADGSGEDEQEQVIEGVAGVEQKRRRAEL